MAGTIDSSCELLIVVLGVIGLLLSGVSLSGAAGQHRTEVRRVDAVILARGYDVDRYREYLRLGMYAVVLGIGFAGIATPPPTVIRPRWIAVDIGVPILTLLLIGKTLVDIRWRAARYQWQADVSRQLKECGDESATGAACDDRR